MSIYNYLFTKNSKTYMSIEFSASTSGPGPAYNGEILRLHSATIDTLNQCGGLMLFGSSDYAPWMNVELEQIILDAKAIGLRLKTITRQPQFVSCFQRYLDAINLIVMPDDSAASWETAATLRNSYPNVWIRAMVDEAVDVPRMDWADIIAVNPARNSVTKKERELISVHYPEKLCCQHCLTCNLKCRGVNRGLMAMPVHRTISA